MKQCRNQVKKFFYERMKALGIDEYPHTFDRLSLDTQAAWTRHMIEVRKMQNAKSMSRTIT